MPIFDNFSFRRPSFHFLITLGILAGWILVLLLISDRISLIFTHIPFDYNEGWNAYLGERAVGLVKAPLYPDPDGSLIFNNYPPLSFYLVGGLGYLIGDMVWAGKDYRLDFFNYYQAVKRGASLETLNRAILTPIPTTMVKVTISKKCPTFLLLWQMILSHPHKTQTLSPHVEMIEMTPPKQKN